MKHCLKILNRPIHVPYCMLDTFARAHTRPKG